MSDSLRPHEPQHARPPCPSPTPEVHPNPCSSSQWCHPTISSSVIPFSSCPLSFPASGSLKMNQLFASGGQSIGVSASASILPMNTQDWSPLGWTGWVSLQSKGPSRVFSNTTVQKHQFFWTQRELYHSFFCDAMQVLNINVRALNLCVESLKLRNSCVSPSYQKRTVESYQNLTVETMHKTTSVVYFTSHVHILPNTLSTFSYW